jgi:hypothetical protein
MRVHKRQWLYFPTSTELKSIWRWYKREFRAGGVPTNAASIATAIVEDNEDEALFRDDFDVAVGQREAYAKRLLALRARAASP